MLESKEYTGHSSWVPEAFYAQFQFQSSLKKWPVFSCLCLRPLAKDDCVGRRMQEKTSGTQGSCGHALLHNENAWKARNFSGIKEQFSPVLALSRLGVPETIQVKSPRLFLVKALKAWEIFSSHLLPLLSSPHARTSSRFLPLATKVSGI